MEKNRFRYGQKLHLYFLFLFSFSEYISIWFICCFAQFVFVWVCERDFRVSLETKHEIRCIEIDITIIHVNKMSKRTHWCTQMVDGCAKKQHSTTNAIKISILMICSIAHFSFSSVSFALPLFLSLSSCANSIIKNNSINLIIIIVF